MDTSSPGPINDEVIADSEGEMDEEDHPGNQGLPANVKDIVSQVSAFTLPAQLHGNTTSSISAFSKQSSNTGGQLSEVENFLGTASIADRAKTRQRNLKSSIQSSVTKTNAVASSAGRLEINGNTSSDIIELTSDEDDDELNLRPPNSKSKARPKPKLRVKDKPRNTSNDKTIDVPGTTETNTDNPPHTIPDSRPRPRPRPRPLVKRNKPAQESTGPPPLVPPDIPGLLPSSSASASHGPELPIATSPVQPYLHTSQLPPSDPPLPTLTTIHGGNDLPSIETLDFDGPLSSPSSLFSDFDGTKKKRKRTAFDLDVDELASDVDFSPRKGHTGAGALYHHDDDVAPQVPPHLLPPPPTFFAGSSSSSIGGGGGDRRPPPQVPSDLARDVVDLTMLPPTIQPIGATATKTATKKAKISRQKNDDATRMDEDELDDDFDPTESTKKRNPKPKPKPKAKKGKAKGEGRAQVEGPKPRTQKTGGKGKGKAAAVDTNTFKSREFIDDSGDDQDPIQLAPRLSPGDPGKSMSSSSSNRINKKRKSIIESDPEDEDGDEGGKDQQAIGTSSKKHKYKQGKNSGNVDDQRPSPEAEEAKENVMKPTPKAFKTDERPNIENPALFPSLHSRYEIAPRRNSVPMSELIRRANSVIGSPFSTPQPRTSSSSSARPTKSGTPITTTYSPCLKTSRSILSRIAPLHPNRKPPPPPPPPLPPKKKTKKELEMEEKWEEEMIESVGGISEWTCLADDEKKELRRAKWAKEMGDWDD